MRVLSPEWLIFAPVLVFCGWRWGRLRLGRPLRILVLGLALLILAHPEIRRLGEGLDLWVLVDRSASVAELLAPRIGEWEALLEASRGRDDRLFLVDFADTVIARETSDRDLFRGSGQETRLALAIQYALAEMPEDRAARLLVLSDGYSTEPLAGLTGRLVAEATALDYRLLTGAGVGDVRIDRIRMPTRVQIAEPFLVEVDLAGDPDQPVAYAVYRDDRQVGAGTVALAAGQAAIRFADRVGAPGGHRYRVRIDAEADAHPGNNGAEAWIEVAGGPRVLLVSGYDPDPLADVLSRQGFAVETVTRPETLQPGALSGTRAVILNNVPAYRVSAAFLDALDFYVRMQGGGLAMYGGRFSFGAGGYFESPIDALLPVAMDLREEHKKLSVAMAIVMDRSGSMAAGVAGALAGTTKMDLANEGAARAIELLGGLDQVAVFAVDSEPHTVIELAQVGPARAELVHAVRRIRSAGGGIFVYNGLEAAWRALQGAQAGQRHVILFADAADAEQPGDYQRLLAEMTAAGATVSVIGLGTELDSDAAFLTDIAARGNGRIFFNANPGDLPALFAQEAVAVARSAFIEEAVGTADAGGWMELAARPMDWPAAVDGYNLSYLRPDATAAVVTTDAYRAPLVGHWQRGLGRVAAVSFPTGGEFSDSVRAWGGYGDFVQTLTRWLMGEELPPGVGLRTRLEGTTLAVDLLYDDWWEERMARSAPELVVAHLGEPGTRSCVWRRLDPGHYRAELQLPARASVRGAVQLGAAALPFGPVTAGTNPEWAFDRTRIDELAALSRISGGEERLDLTRVWNAPRRPSFRDLRPWLLAAWLLAILAEALVTRMGWGLPRFAGRRTPPPGRPTRAPTPGPQPDKPPGVAPSPVPPTPEPPDQRRRRLAQAKRHHP